MGGIRDEFALRALTPLVSGHVGDHEQRITGRIGRQCEQVVRSLALIERHTRFGGLRAVFEHACGQSAERRIRPRVDERRPYKRSSSREQLDRRRVGIRHAKRGADGDDCVMETVEQRRHAVALHRVRLREHAAVAAPGGRRRRRLCQRPTDLLAGAGAGPIA